MGFLMGKIRPFLTELQPLFVWEKTVSGTVYDNGMKFSQICLT